jgi:hypothetical protein
MHDKASVRPMFDIPRSPAVFPLAPLSVHTDNLKIRRNRLCSSRFSKMQCHVTSVISAYCIRVQQTQILIHRKRLVKQYKEYNDLLQHITITIIKNE